MTWWRFRYPRGSHPWSFGRSAWLLLLMAGWLLSTVAQDSTIPTTDHKPKELSRLVVPSAEATMACACPPPNTVVMNPELPRHNEVLYSQFYVHDPFVEIGTNVPAGQVFTTEGIFTGTYGHDKAAPSTPGTPVSSDPLAWSNVAVASGLMVINGIISLAMGLRMEGTLFISGFRCLVQLTIMGFLLEDIFATRNPIVVFGMACFLVLMATYETVFSKCKRRHTGMFWSVITTMFTSSLMVASLGGIYALNASPFWYPYKFIPTVGMLLGNAMTGTALGLNVCLTTLTEHRERVETYLALGASRWEAVRPVAVEAMRSAMLPSLNNMSIMGLISIPGMMTGQILGGVPVLQAVKYQQIIMFMIVASTGLGSLGAVITCLHTVVDGTHRLRLDRIYPSSSMLAKEKRELKRTKRFFFGASPSTSSSSSDELCTLQMNHEMRMAPSHDCLPPHTVWSQLYDVTAKVITAPVHGILYLGRFVRTWSTPTETSPTPNNAQVTERSRLLSPRTTAPVP
ncbi:hypothetical protein IWQ62_001213 [Dispira parvispora]|uniref:Uncharacterized protein n=1 Tax=Dispira parvispora TaxID=1520584 RepID=A0A9W8AVJ9_9FUNG|nr:hypothetical protein IWQ62_001213 [Dispira parvispora]